MLGLNRSETSFRVGSPVVLPKDFGTDVILPKNFGNVVPAPSPFFDSNPVTWKFNPAQFGTIIGN
jgi:hypothetical protein